MASNLIVLGDSAVSSLLTNLSREETMEFQEAIAKSLRDMSVGEEGQYQTAPGIINRPGGQKILFRPFTSSDAVGTKIIVDPAPVKGGNGEVLKKDPLHGALVLLNASGIPTGLINAEEVTGYRTSLSALIPFMWRRTVENIVLFGGGKQALWHFRLAMRLRGSEIRKITVVNRSVSKAQELVEKMEAEFEGRLSSDTAIGAAEFCYVDSSDQSSITEALSEADVVFCTIPSTSPLFSPEALLGAGTRQTQPLVTAIGSWQSQMIEVDPRIIQHAARDVNAGGSDESPKGVVLVDDLKEVLHSTGEIVQAGLKEEEVVELGRVVDWRRSDTQSAPRWDSKVLDGLLSDGFVVYKSVGVGVTDLVSGEKILDMARRKNMGTIISDFC